MSADTGAVRIGEFARRVGVSAELLRAWERRYNLLLPVRSEGGFRLYTEADAQRVSRMRQALGEGMSAAEAARRVLAGERPAEHLMAGATERLLEAIAGYDESAVQLVLDESLAAFGVEPVLRDLILPVLREVGCRWARGALGVSHEHFASNLLRGRMLSLARLWGRGHGPLALLACLPGEAHDIGLLAFGLALRSHGWRIVFLGADTPMRTLADAAHVTAPSLVVLTSFTPALIVAQAVELRALAERFAVVLTGPGVDGEPGERLCGPGVDGERLGGPGVDRERLGGPGVDRERLGGPGVDRERLGVPALTGDPVSAAAAVAEARR